MPCVPCQPVSPLTDVTHGTHRLPTRLRLGAAQAMSWLRWVAWVTLFILTTLCLAAPPPSASANDIQVALDGAMFWPSAESGALIENVTLNGNPSPQTVPAGSEVAVGLDYTIVDRQCPGCIDQIQYGWVDTATGAGDPVLGQCLYDGIPGPAGVSGHVDLALVAPVEPGTYALAYDRAQAFGCGDLTGWWSGPPTSVQYIATLQVQAPTNESPLATIPPVILLTLTPGETKRVAGRLSTDPSDNVADPNGGIVAEDTVGNLALAGLLDGVSETCCYQNTTDFVFTDLECNGQILTQPGFQLFSDGDWRVDQGTLNGIEPPPPAFTIYEAARQASCFAGTQHALFYRFASREDHTVYDFQNGQLNALLTVTADQIVVDGWTRLGPLVANDIEGSRTLVIVPTATHTSPLHALGTGVEGATIATTPVGRHVQLRYTVPGQPFDTERDFAAGPADFDNTYGHQRPFFHVTDGTRFGLVWQSRDDGAVYVTWFASDPAQFETHALPTPSDAVLAGATSDGAGTLYTFMIQAGNGACPRRDREVMPPVCADDVTRVGTLLKTDASGNELSRRSPDMGANGLDVVEFGTLDVTRWVADLQHANGRLGLILGRLTHMAPDGLNHQGAIAVVFDADSLALLQHHGQTSGHSWDNVLNLDAESHFLGVDLGDNFPRGVHLHRFSETARASRVVYTFKTQHGQTPSNGAGQTFDVFTEISDGQTTFYRWSNDNRTYTELGGVLDTPQAILVAFASERSGLDNQRTQQALNDPRDLALVSLRRDFEMASRDPNSATVVTDDLVLSLGDAAVEGGYYTFTGGWTPQRNAGVVWLTNYGGTSQNASRVKLHPLSANEALILWELWGPSLYQETYAMSVRPDGTVVQPPVALNPWFRLNRRDDLFDHAGDIYAVAGAGATRQLILNILVRGE